MYGLALSNSYGWFIHIWEQTKRNIVTNYSSKSHNDTQFWVIRYIRNAWKENSLCFILLQWARDFATTVHLHWDNKIHSEVRTVTATMMTMMMREKYAKYNKLLPTHRSDNLLTMKLSVSKMNSAFRFVHLLHLMNNMKSIQFYAWP